MSTPHWACAGAGAVHAKDIKATTAWHMHVYTSEAPMALNRAPCLSSPFPASSRSGWGYMLSRDLAEVINNAALLFASVPDK